MSEISQNQVEQICRLCAEKLDYKLEKPSEKLMKIVEKFLMINIDHDNGLPQGICNVCEAIVISFNNFSLRCFQMQEKLVEKYQLNVKDEHYYSIELKAESPLDNSYDDLYNSFENVISKNEKKVKFRHRSKRIKKAGRLKQIIKLECIECKEHFCTITKVQKHFVDKHDKEPHIWCKCGAEIRSSGSIHRHAKTHCDPEDVFKCTEGPNETKDENGSCLHDQNAFQYQCDQCSKWFKHKSRLKNHISAHCARKRTAYCKLCPSKFSSPSGLYSHIRTVHLKLKRFICHYCGFKCGTNSELTQHCAKHSERKDHVCKLCGLGFKTKSILYAHFDTHSLTSYKCEICSKILNSKRTLSKHQLVHNDVYKHTCHHCGKKFKRKHTLDVHISSHTGAKNLKCPYCPERFKYASSRSNHKKKSHPHLLENARRDAQRLKQTC